MNFEKYTSNATKRITEAESLAFENKNPTLEPIHLLASSFATPDSIVPELLRQSGGDPRALSQSAQTKLSSLARVEGSATNPMLSAELREVFMKAEKLAEKLNDDYVTEEHLLISLSESPSLKDIFQSANFTTKSITSAVEKIRAGERVTSPDAESLQ